MPKYCVEPQSQGLPTCPQYVVALRRSRRLVAGACDCEVASWAVVLRTDGANALVCSTTGYICIVRTSEVSSAPIEPTTVADSALWGGKHISWLERRDWPLCSLLLMGDVRQRFPYLAIYGVIRTVLFSTVGFAGS